MIHNYYLQESDYASSVHSGVSSTCSDQSATSYASAVANQCAALSPPAHLVGQSHGHGHNITHVPWTQHHSSDSEQVG